MKLSTVLITIICLILYYQYYLWGNEIDIHVIDSHLPGPNLLIISGTHGNEPAGRLVVEEWLKNHVPIKKGKIYVIPRSNKSGSIIGLRYMLHNLLFPDLNRNYTDNGREPVSQKIIEIINKNQIEFILDFHEGWGFHKTNKKSIGSTLSPTTPFSKEISSNLVDLLNQQILQENKHFVLNTKTDDLLTLRNYAIRKKLDYILIETTGQNGIQPIEIRKKQVSDILNYVLNILYYN